MAKGKYVTKIRINISISPALLKKIDKAAGPFERSSFISNSCLEMLDKKASK
tara:strand:- start:680 stop:835 length:156 start_codon:yes stop_codon:yes gene_type:complete